ncbi:hypothetical protein EDD15DRAFT_2196650 [Pisolithus albus]|nr:hypothetical protein EDD15DRAFT_2196650 [Pisolithus albus]
MAAAKVDMTLLPPILECPTETPSNNNVADTGPLMNAASNASSSNQSSASTVMSKSKTKFQPSGTKNGRNLCALRWLKQVDANGDKDDFRAYYDKTLTKTQREAYDVEAKQLVATNGWTKAAIKCGTLY